MPDIISPRVSVASSRSCTFSADSSASSCGMTFCKTCDDARHSSRRSPVCLLQFAQIYNCWAGILVFVIRIIIDARSPVVARFRDGSGRRGVDNHVVEVLADIPRHLLRARIAQELRHLVRSRQLFHLQNRLLIILRIAIMLRLPRRRSPQELRNNNINNLRRQRRRLIYKRHQDLVHMKLGILAQLLPRRSLRRARHDVEEDGKEMQQQRLRIIHIRNEDDALDLRQRRQHVHMLRIIRIRRVRQRRQNRRHEQRENILIPAMLATSVITSPSSSPIQQAREKPTFNCDGVNGASGAQIFSTSTRQAAANARTPRSLWPNRLGLHSSLATLPSDALSVSSWSSSASSAASAPSRRSSSAVGIAFPARHERGSSKVRAGSEGSTGGAAEGGARRGAMATEVARCEVCRG
ncbi:hypothetical protein GMDG_02303 [Pseudogymnoascus destructans 20631-21]|uniref:Uncharacterized protein n=1 Tax=Pseudogymnoascus destructans (strain ATCC MYA-4855 / 20631-21) TaxID=658429 RepID=L8G2M2_PSED2|nr:hypothetical protein GMDG_02303 [Pseudogymnoascus destructans 20631-21]